MAWRGVTGLRPLPASPGNSLTSCLNLCFPAGPFALAQVPVTQQWAWLHHSFVLTEPRSRSCLPFEGHILSGPRLWSARMGTSTCCL